MLHSKEQSSIGEAKGRGEQGRLSQYGSTACLALCPAKYQIDRVRSELPLHYRVEQLARSVTIARLYPGRRRDQER